MHEREYRDLLGYTLLTLAACLAAVVVCYFWIDRPVAFFVYDHQVAKIEVFKWLTYPPPLMQTWSPAILALLAVRRAWGPWTRWQQVLFVATLSLIVADEFRVSLGDVCGRYWPETWRNNNPSLIGNDTYGFHPFKAGDDIGSFPSGHATRVFSFAIVWWLAVPRSRALWIVICPPLAASLVAMNYHFVGDVIAGACLGAIVGVYAVHLAGVSVSCESPDGTRCKPC